jgi:hypothetical protein
MAPTESMADVMEALRGIQETQSRLVSVVSDLSRTMPDQGASVSALFASPTTVLAAPFGDTSSKIHDAESPIVAIEPILTQLPSADLSVVATTSPPQKSGFTSRIILT